MANNNRNGGNRGGGKRPPQPKRYKGKNVSPFSGPTQLYRDTKQVLKNIAFGTFDINKDGHKLQNADWINMAIFTAQKEANKNWVIYTSVELVNPGTTNVDILTIIEDHRKGMQGWCMVAEMLNSYRSTGDIGLIYGLMNRLPDYKYVM